MVKEKTKKKEKKRRKGVSLPKTVKKGQITKTELKSVGFTKPDNQLKGSAPVESISGIGVKKGSMLRKEGIETVTDYRKGFKEFFIEMKKKKKKVPKKKPVKKIAKVPVKDVESDQRRAERELAKELAKVQKKDVEDRPVYKTGNEYIIDQVTAEMLQKPKLKDWKNEQGKIRRRALRRHIINIYEAEYGKDSKVTQQVSEFTKDVSGKDLFVMLKNLSDNYPNDFPPEEELLKEL